MESDEILRLYDKNGLDLVKEALRRAVSQGKRTISYVRGILSRWKSSNLRTIQEVLCHEAAIEEQKGKRASQNGRDSPHDAAKVVQINQKRRDEKIKAACDYIVYQLGKDPPRDKAEKIALGYGEEYMAEILERVYGGSP